MAHLSGTQKKQKNSFIAMIIAIILVIAAIAYVVFGGLTAKSSLLVNQDLATALSELLGKAPAFISEQDLADIKYFSVNYDSNEETANLMLGDDAFVDMYAEYTAKLDAEEDVSSYDFTGLFKTVDFKLDKEDTLLDDVKYFTGARTIEIAGVTFTDSSVFSGLTNLETVYINSCGLTEVAGLGGVDPEKITKINLTGNSITDWSPLDIVKDKVIVSTYYTVQPTEDGSFDFNNMVLVEQTLTQYYEEQAAKAEKEENENASVADEATDVTTENAEEVAE